MRLGKWTVPQLVQTCSLSPCKHGNILMSHIRPSGMMYMGMNGRILNPKIWSVFVLLHPVSFLGQLIKRYLARLTSLFRTVHSLCPVAILSSYWLFLTPSLFGFAVVNNLSLVLSKNNLVTEIWYCNSRNQEISQFKKVVLTCINYGGKDFFILFKSVCLKWLKKIVSYLTKNFFNRRLKRD